MSSLIRNLRIQNFKSVRDLSLECDRINVFIGKPNAGKSNILEAISLLGAGYSEGKKFMEGMVRYQTLLQVFSDYDFHKKVTVTTEKVAASLSFSNKGESFSLTIWNPAEERKRAKTKIGAVDLPLFDLKRIEIDSSGKILSISNTQTNIDKQIKGYNFKSIRKHTENGLLLRPPHGDNFYSIVRTHKLLREEIQEFLKPNGLKLFLDDEAKRVLLVKETEDGFLSFPLHLVPDTFQRYIFHLAAIMSNRDSVLLFEEPESHSYAPYVYQLAQHILDDEGGNQYFLTTHNPYLLTPILQEGKDVALFVTWFENYETRARRLTEEELREILDYGVDMFLNLDHFIPE